MKLRCRHVWFPQVVSTFAARAHARATVPSSCSSPRKPTKSRSSRLTPPQPRNLRRPAHKHGGEGRGHQGSPLLDLHSDGARRVEGLPLLLHRRHADVRPVLQRLWAAEHGVRLPLLPAAHREAERPGAREQGDLPLLPPVGGHARELGLPDLHVAAALPGEDARGGVPALPRAAAGADAVPRRVARPVDLPADGAALPPASTLRLVRPRHVRPRRVRALRARRERRLQLDRPRLLPVLGADADPIAYVDGVKTNTPETYFDYYRKNGITGIIGFNNKVYDRKKFLDAGFNHYDMYVAHGAIGSRPKPHTSRPISPVAGTLPTAATRPTRSSSGSSRRRTSTRRAARSPSTARRGFGRTGTLQSLYK